MTVILALLNRNGQPVEPPVVDAMLARSALGSSDNQDRWSDAGVALAHQHFWITPEEIGERQPLWDPNGRCAITFDGRLDNREALIGWLGLAPAQGQGLTDAALTLRSYERWGTGCVNRLLGGFVFAVWDAARGELFVARDALGERSACYYLDRNLFALASEAGQLLAHPAVKRRLNEARVAEYLEGLWVFEEETYYQDVFYCPPGHCLLVSAGGFRKWRYWDLDPDATIRYRRHEEYVEHFRTLLFEAVRCHLRVAGPVGVWMSGGIDSTSIAAVASQLLAETGHAGERLKSISYVYDELPSCDERQYILPVIQHCGLDAEFVRGDELWPLRDFEHWPVHADIPGQDLLAWLVVETFRIARQSGLRVLLTGVMGDELFYGWHSWVTDVVRELRFGVMARELASHFSLVDWRGDVLIGLWQLVPETLRRSYRRLRPVSTEWSHPGLHPDLAARTGLLERKRRHLYSERYSRPDQWRRYRVLIGSSVTVSKAAARRVFLAHGLERSDPLLDRRLVEFAMALPADELGLPHRTKRLLRDAMQGLLPEPVRERIGKTSVDALLERGLLEREQATVRAILKDPQIVQRDLVRAEWLEQQVRAGRNWSNGGYSLWGALTLELWLDRHW